MKGLVNRRLCGNEGDEYDGTLINPALVFRIALKWNRTKPSRRTYLSVDY